jgi:peptidoglycan/xylan/chitin deacetylase (PgdA/CDA1 family)
MKTHGDAGWESYPSYLDVVVPRVLELFREMDLRISFFVVGKDSALEKNRAAMAALGESNHEVASHSFNHEPWLHLYSEEEIDRELAEAEAHIESATGRRPRGFRGPGFSLSEATLRVLIRRGYRYDASTFPTFIGPLARAYYFMNATLDSEERHKRAALFGSLREGIRPLRPYRWRVGDDTLLELPVTTFPVFRVPIHASYVLYLSMYSEKLAWTYFSAALRSCRALHIQPSILLHPLDFLGGEEVPALSFFPAMGLSVETKLARIRRYLRILTTVFEVVSTGEHVDALDAEQGLRLVAPRFGATGDR